MPSRPNHCRSITAQELKQRIKRSLLQKSSSGSARHNLVGLLLLCSTVHVCFSSCANSAHELTFDELIGEYRSLADSVEQQDCITVSELPCLVNRWMSIEDNIYCVLADKDSVDTDSCNYVLREITAQGSRIIDKVFSSIDNQKITYVDVVNVYQSLNLAEYAGYTLLDSAYLLFKEHQDVMADIKDPKEQVEQIVSFQNEVTGMEVNDFDIIKKLLLQEDMLYRVFADNLILHDSEDFRRVNANNNALTNKMLSFVIEHEEMRDQCFAYYCARNTQRVTYMARVGLKAIHETDLSNREQAAKILACITEPFRNFSPFMDCARTDEQWKDYMEIAKEVPEALTVLDSMGYETSSISQISPNHMLKRVIAFLFSD